MNGCAVLQMRKALEGVMSEKQDELVRLQNDLLQTTNIRDKASREAEELRNLWEAEVRGRGKGEEEKGEARITKHCCVLLCTGEDQG